MPRDGALILSDVRSPSLGIVCETRGPRGCYNSRNSSRRIATPGWRRSPIAKGRVPPASMTAARPCTRDFEVGHYEGRRRWAVAICRPTRPIAWRCRRPHDAPPARIDRPTTSDEHRIRSRRLRSSCFTPPAAPPCGGRRIEHRWKIRRCSRIPFDGDCGDAEGSGHCSGTPALRMPSKIGPSWAR